MIDALTNCGVDPTAFLVQASNALTEQDAIYFERLAQVLAAYSMNKAQLRTIRTENGVVSAQDRNGTVVVPLSCDYAIWSERNAGRLTDFANLMQGDPDVKGLTLWMDGKVSDRGRQELKSRKIDLATDVLDKP